MCLTFIVEGDPKPTVKWFKDNKEIRKWRAKLTNKGKFRIFNDTNLFLNECYG